MTTLTTYCDKCGGYLGGGSTGIKDPCACNSPKLKIKYTDIPICSGCGEHIAQCICHESKTQKQPFRCPVCYGKGTVYPVLTEYWEKEWLNRDGTTNKPCHSCNGTGIVWG